MLEVLVVVLPVLWWAVVGGVVASGASAVAGRVAAGVSVLDRSRCSCGRPLGPSELVPVVSWLAVRGTARCCGSRIPSRLLVGEIAGVVVTAAAAWAGGWTAAVVVVTGVAVVNGRMSVRAERAAR